MDIRGEKIFINNSVFFSLDPLPLLDPVGEMRDPSNPEGSNDGIHGLE